MFFSKIRKILYTPVNPSFTIYKSGVLGGQNYIGMFSWRWCLFMSLNPYQVPWKDSVTWLCPFLGFPIFIVCHFCDAILCISTLIRCLGMVVFRNCFLSWISIFNCLPFLWYSVFQNLSNAKNIDCWYSLEPPRRSGSDDYSQSMFWAGIWKLSEFFIWTFSYFAVKVSIYLNSRVWFVCVEVLRPSQPSGVMSSAVSLPNHTFTGQA